MHFLFWVRWENKKEELYNLIHVLRSHATWKRLQREKVRRGPGWKTWYLVVKVWDEGMLGQSGSSIWWWNKVRIWIYLKLEPTGFDGKLYVNEEGRRGIKNKTKVFDLSKQKHLLFSFFNLFRNTQHLPVSPIRIVSDCQLRCPSSVWPHATYCLPSSSESTWNLKLIVSNLNHLVLSSWLEL